MSFKHIVLIIASLLSLQCFSSDDSLPIVESYAKDKQAVTAFLPEGMFTQKELNHGAVTLNDNTVSNISSGIRLLPNDVLLLSFAMNKFHIQISDKPLQGIFLVKVFTRSMQSGYEVTEQFYLEQDYFDENAKSLSLR